MFIRPSSIHVPALRVSGYVIHVLLTRFERKELKVPDHDGMSCDLFLDLFLAITARLLILAAPKMSHMGVPRQIIVSTNSSCSSGMYIIPTVLYLTGRLLGLLRTFRDEWVRGFFSVLARFTSHEGGCGREYSSCNYKISKLMVSASEDGS